MGGMRWLVAVMIALATAGCATDPPVRGEPGSPFRDREGRDGPPRPAQQLFISPSGQPFRAHPGAPYPSAAWFAAVDRNQDGRLDRTEHRLDAAAWFKVVDSDADGRISMLETTHWEEELVPEILRGDAMDLSGPGRRRGGPPGRNELDSRRQGAGPYSLINEPHPIRGADLDLSMSVDAAEWTAAADRRFRLLDRDGDGAVTEAELGEAPVQTVGRGPRPHPLRR